MLIIGGTFEVEPDQREEFLASKEEGMRRSRAEPGCIEYVFGADPIDPGRVVLYERWESQESLDTHLAVLRAAPPAADPGPQPKSASILVYDVTGERRLQ